MWSHTYHNLNYCLIKELCTQNVNFSNKNTIFPYEFCQLCMYDHSKNINKVIEITRQWFFFQMFAMLTLEIPGAGERRGCGCSANLPLCNSVIFCLTEIHQFIELQKSSELFGQTQSATKTVRNKLERESLQLTVTSGCRLSVSGSRQRCKRLLAWMLPEIARSSVMFRVASFLPSSACPAQAGSRSTCLGDSAASVFLLLCSEFLNTRQTDIAECLFKSVCLPSMCWSECPISSVQQALILICICRGRNT